jgi:TonB family protein
MSALINYLIEANLGLVVFLLLYWLLLRHETNFTFNRAFLLVAILVSLTFPLFHFTAQTRFLPTISALVPSMWLPEVVVYGDGNPIIDQSQRSFDAWMWTRIVYLSGIVIAFSVFIYRLTELLRMIKVSQSYSLDKFTILESNKGDLDSFSFFNYIFIGKSAELTMHEKALIIDHERIHARQFHSFDILLINMIGVVFWFNPVVKIYKKIFVHLHEYEADARSVKSHDVNDYCSLLAKVALLSADIRLANHFSSSLTVKRIEMMRKFKSKIKPWKIAALFGTIPVFFFAVSCQDQLVGDVTEIARNSSVAMDAPQAVVDRFEAVKKANPGSTYVLVEFNEEGDRLLEKMEKEHGIPSSIELFTPDNGLYKNSTMNTEPEKITFNQSKEWEQASAGTRTFAIIQYNSVARKIAEASKDANDVFTIVDDTAQPANGLAEFYEHVGKKVKYPTEARKLGIEGKVFVEFVVQTDGSISNVKAVKGIGAGCDEIAEEVVRTSPSKWIPGKHGGVPVKQRVVLPITFKLASSEIVVKDETAAPSNAIEEVVVMGYKDKKKEDQ